jgi:HEAT repeat protein
MKPAGKLDLLLSVLLLSGCFQEEAPRVAVPAPAADTAQKTASASPSGMRADMDFAARLQDAADPEDRRDAIYEIADAEGDEMDSAALIGAALYDPEPDVRLSAVQALTGLRNESAADWLAIALGDPDARVRRTAVEALGEIGGPNARFLLQQALGDVDPAVRETAQEMLGEPSPGEPGVS